MSDIIVDWEVVGGPDHLIAIGRQEIRDWYAEGGSAKVRTGVKDAVMLDIADRVDVRVCVTEEQIQEIVQGHEEEE